MMKKPDLFFFNQFNCELFEAHNSRSMSQYHYHDAYEIFFLADGNRDMEFNGMRMPLQRGDLFIAQPFVPHRSERHEPGYYKRYILNFSVQDLNEFFSKTEITAVTEHLTTGVYHLAPEQAERVQGCLERICDHHARYTDLGHKMTIMEIFLALDYINSLVYAQQRLSVLTPQKTAGLHPAVTLSVNYIKEHYTEEISLDFIAELVHLSKSQFCRVFQETTGTSFMQYLNSYRLTQAHMLISHSKKPLHVIAAETGFYSTEHMTRTFQKTHKMSPSQWRREYRDL